MLPSSILSVKCCAKISFRFAPPLVLVKMFRFRIRKYLTAPISLMLISAIISPHLPSYGGVDVTRGRTEDSPALFAKCWEYPGAVDLGVAPVTDGANVYFLNPENKIGAADLSTAAKLWSTEIGGDVVSNILVVDHALFLVTNAQSAGPSKTVLRSHSKQTGITNWSAELPSSTGYYLGAVGGKLISLSYDGAVSAITSTGETEWTRNLGAIVTAAPHFGERRLTVGTNKKEIVTVSVESGEISVVATADHSPTAVFSGSDGRHIFGDERGNLVLLGADGDQIWKFKNGAKISFISRSGSDYLAASYDNFIYKFSRGGNVEWKRRLNGRVASDPIVVDGTIVASTIGDGTVFVLRLKNGKILNQIEGDGDDSGGLVILAGREDFIRTTAKGLALYSRKKCVSK